MVNKWTAAILFLASCVSAQTQTRIPLDGKSRDLSPILRQYPCFGVDRRPQDPTPTPGGQRCWVEQPASGGPATALIFEPALQAADERQVKESQQRAQTAEPLSDIEFALIKDDRAALKTYVQTPCAGTQAQQANCEAIKALARIVRAQLREP